MNQYFQEKVNGAFPDDFGFILADRSNKNAMATSNGTGFYLYKSVVIYFKPTDTCQRNEVSQEINIASNLKSV